MHSRQARIIARKLVQSLSNDQGTTIEALPNPTAIHDITDALLDVILVRQGIEVPSSEEQFIQLINVKLGAIAAKLETQIAIELSHAGTQGSADAIVTKLFDELPAILDLTEGDIGAAIAGDPAARSPAYVRLSYPGIFAITVYRIAHVILHLGCPLIARILTEYAHEKTGIDIHPGATIGKRFFIDHGTGVVIGETSVIGDDVAIYQGVTLGAQSFPRKPDGSFDLTKKRHPTIGNRVKIYADAAILGKEKVADGSIVGSGTRLILKEDIPANTVIIPEKQVMRMKTGK
ncbi:MAG: serine O-acetyltransferase [Candidatus Peribacteraceae bacterium]|nr:serine O-acetyltransferase [Candidatus Peribacteraceae bacterium]